MIEERTFPALPERSEDRTEEVRLALRARALFDNYFLATGILGYKDLVPQTHRPICRFLEQVEIPRRLILHPRSTFKTTLAVVVDSIRLIANDPSIRILLVSDNDVNATTNLKEIKAHFEKNALFQWVFSEIIPENFNKMRWSDNELEVPRSATWKEATITAMGASTGIESRHFDVIKADDLISQKHIHSAAEMDKINKWVTSLEPLLISEDKTIDFIGSRKMRGDVYDTIERFYGAQDSAPIPIGPYAELRGDLAVFSRSIQEDGKSIFAERFSDRFVERMKKNDPERFHAEYANNPRASGLNVFRERDLRYFTFGEDPRGVALPILYHGSIEDYHRETDPVHGPDVWGLERIILYDPSVAEKQTSTKQAILVVALARQRRIVLEAFIGHYPPDEAITLLFELNEKWHPSFISVEKRGFQGSIKYWLEERSETTKVDPLPIVEWPPEGSPKAQWAKTEHIRGLQPLVRNNLIWLHPSMQELIDEFATFPSTRWDDGLDALAQGLEYWPYQEEESEREERERSEDQFLQRVLRGTAGMRPFRSSPPLRGVDREKIVLAALNSGGYGFARWN